MLAHPLLRSVAAATLALALATGLLLFAAPGFEAGLAGAPLALLQRAENAPDTGRVLWVDPGEAGSDLAKQRGQAAKAVDAARAGGAAAILLAVPLEQSSDGADLARIRSFLEGADASPDPAMRERLTGWVAELDHDSQLERSIRAAGNVVLLAPANELPLERFTAAARAVGYEPAVAPDADGVARADRLLGGDGSALAAPSATLATWLVAHGLGRGDVRRADGGVAAGATLLRTGRHSSWIPHYGRRANEQGGTQRLELAALADGKVAAAALSGKIVVIGRGAATVAVPTGPGLWLGEALAQRIASLDGDNYATEPRLAPLLVIALLLIAIAYAALLAPRWSAGTRLTGTLMIALGLLAAELIVLAAARALIPTFECGLALVLAVLAVWAVPEPRPSPAPRATSTVPAARAAAAPRPPPKPGAPAPAAGRVAPPAPAAPPTSPPSLREISETLEARREEPTRAEVADLLLGRSKRPPKPRLGRYELDRELGRGAMGTVYLGRDPRINRVVAIKAIPIVEEFSDQDLAEARARFFREAEMAGRLKHPGIVTVYDAGEDGGIAWIAMEYVKGHLLSEYAVSDRLLPPAAVLEVVSRVAEALDYAHAQDVIHRDIKPANVMFDPTTLETKITDFGIARLTNSTSTRTGIVLGTPSFMAPEQLEGRNVTGRSDLFALGVTLFQLLAGQLPFRADSMTGLMDKIANAEHPPLHTIRPDLPACVSAIVDRALMKDPAARFQTAGDMARALRACAAALSG